MLDQFKAKLERDMLKYSAGHAIFCPKCNCIADYRKWVMVERVSDGKHIGACCADCFDTAAENRTMPAQYRIIRYTKPAKKPVNRFHDTLQIRTPSGAPVPDPIPAKKAFRMFGHQFYLHGRIGADLKPSRPGYTVSHECGAAIAYGDSMAATIRAAKSKLEINGEEKFIAALEKVSR